MRATQSIAQLLAFLGVLGIAVEAQATPVTYGFASGSATVTAFYNGSQITSGNPIALTGVQVTFDASALTVPSFEFTAGPTGALPLQGPLAGVNITLDSVDIVPGAGYTSSASGSDPYTFTAVPISVSGSATLSGGIVAGPIAFSFSNPVLVGQISTTGGGSLSLNGITLGVLNTQPVGSFPGGPVTLKADLLFTGAEVVPEPSTALLLGSALMAVAVTRRLRF